MTRHEVHRTSNLVMASDNASVGVVVGRHILGLAPRPKIGHPPFWLRAKESKGNRAFQKAVFAWTGLGTGWLVAWRWVAWPDWLVLVGRGGQVGVAAWLGYRQAELELVALLGWCVASKPASQLQKEPTNDRNATSHHCSPRCKPMYPHSS